MLGYSDDTLYVAVENEWIKEWLENRLLRTIQRTVTGVVGETAKVMFVTEEVWRLWQTALDALQSQVPQEVF